MQSLWWSSRSLPKRRCRRQCGAEDDAAEDNAVREEFELHQKKATPAPDVAEEVPPTPLGPGTPEPIF